MIQADVSGAVKIAVEKINSQIVSRAFRAANELRNAELDVLRGQRGGRVYRRSPYRSTYTGSAPGQPPAMRSGNLRRSFRPFVKGGKGGNATAVIESGTHYAGYLQDGTKKMAPRPFREPIIDKAKPRVMAIFSESYL